MNCNSFIGIHTQIICNPLLHRFRGVNTDKVYTDCGETDPDPKFCSSEFTNVSLYPFAVAYTYSH